MCMYMHALYRHVHLTCTVDPLVFGFYMYTHTHWIIMDISTSSSLTKLTDFVEAFELFKDKESHCLAYKKRLTDSHYSLNVAYRVT